MTDWVCANCKSINRANARTCYSCGGDQVADLSGGFGAPVAATAGGGALATTDVALAGGPALALAPDAGANPLGVEAAMRAERPGQAAGPMDLIGGLLGGTMAAILSTAVWYGVVAATQFQVGLVAVAVGWLVGQGVAYGAQRRFSVGLIPISVVLTVLALAVSEYLIVAHFVSEEIGVAIPLVQPPDFVIEVVTSSLQADPLTLVFWAIALFQAFVIPARLPRPTGGPGAN
jgi:hypothetical protein